MTNSLSSLLLFLLLLSTSPVTLVLGSLSVVSREQERHFHRPDPLRGFRLYEGGYDIRNKHYWVSAAFKGVHGYAIAGVWAVGGLILLPFLPAWKKKCGSSSVLRSRYCHFLTVLAIVIFILLAIISSGLTLAANHSFRVRSKKLERTILGAGEATRHAIRRVLGVMKYIHKLMCPFGESICSLLRTTKTDLATTSRAIRGVMHKADYLIARVLDLTYGVTMGIVCLSLVLIIFAVVVLLVHWHPKLTMVIWICWILTALCWLLSGFHFFLHIYTEDTCFAIEEYKQNPGNNSLSSIIPCPDSASANSIMAEIGFGIHNFIRQLKLNLTEVTSNIIGEEADLFREFTRVWDPFSNPPQYNYDATVCSDDDNSSSILNVLERDKHLFSQENFNKISSYVYAIQGFKSVFSDIQKLTHCSYLKDAFDNILFHQCKPLRASIQLLWFSMISLSICMAALEVAWVVEMLKESGRLATTYSTSPDQQA